MGICGKEFGFALVILLGCAEFGFITVYCSPCGEDIRTKHGLKDTSVQWTLYNSIVFLFAALGPFVDKFILNKFNGRRRIVIFVADLITAVFWFLNCLTKINIYAGIVVRCFLGLATGMFSGITSMYLVEIAAPGYSGFFGSLNQIGIVVGQALYDFLGPSMDYMALNYLGGVVGALQAVLIWFIPESPAAQQSDEIEEKPILAAFKAEYANGLIVGIIFMFVQQFSGINGMLTDLSAIMSAAGLDIDGDYQAGIALCAQFISVFVSSLMVDKLGPKLVWILSSTVCAVGLLMMALNTKFNWSAAFPLVSIFIYVLGFGLGLGPAPWFVIPQFFPLDVRPAANSICVLSNWVFSFIVVMVFPEMKKGMGMFGSFIFFFAVCVFSIFFGIFKVQNPTKDVDEDVEDERSDSTDEKPASL